METKPNQDVCEVILALRTYHEEAIQRFSACRDCGAIKHYANFSGGGLLFYHTVVWDVKRVFGSYLELILGN